jgi:PTH2 family peptidyl-tRNA hydrolase
MENINKNEEFIMYIIVNMDLKMDKGKIASQCCHSSCKVVQILENFENEPDYYKKWLNSNYPKIVLKGNEKLLKFCIDNYSDINKEMWCVHTRDLGRTQIEPNSLTTVAFNPIMRKMTPDFIKELKLL